MTRKPTSIDKIASALSGGGYRGRSPLYRWLWDHYDQLSRHRQGRPDWISVAAEINKLEIAGQGKPPLRPDNVRKTWERVVRDRGKTVDPSPRKSPASSTKALTPRRGGPHHAGNRSSFGQTFTFEAEAKPGDRERLIGPPRKK